MIRPVYMYIYLDVHRLYTHCAECKGHCRIYSLECMSMRHLCHWGDAKYIQISFTFVIGMLFMNSASIGFIDV